MLNCPQVETRNEEATAKQRTGWSFELDGQKFFSQKRSKQEHCRHHR